MIYLDPKNDLTFKRIFGEHPHLCISLLNSLLPLGNDEKIIELEYLPAELVPEIPILKRTIVDVRCKDMKGRQFIVEMQMYWTESFKNRVVFNASKAYVKQLDSAKEYKLLQPVYALNLVNETFEHDMSEFYHHYKIVNTTYPEKTIEGLEFVFVELPKFKAKNLSERKLQYLWLKFLTEIEDGTEVIPKELLEDELINEAINYLASNSYTKAQLEHYDRYWDSILTERSAYLDAEQRGLIEGEAVGKKKGEEIGIKKGEEIGIKKGEEIGKIEIAKNAIKEGLPVEMIIKLTGLPKDEIEKLDGQQRR
ncbi:MAG: hypothetical protein B6D61_09930 [Bacteroidetes bacterium 4484_249]|nr:MAG: hypothetical protein B6D61_09930 [Bacteroidetes bacterium 4484_249]